MKDYTLYTATDFALEEDFQNWVLNPDVKNNYFWRKWVLEHSDKTDVIIEAVILVRSVKFRSYSLSEKKKQQLLVSISNKLDTEKAKVSVKLNSGKAQVSWQSKWKYEVTAAFAGLMLISSL